MCLSGKYHLIGFDRRSALVSKYMLLREEMLGKDSKRKRKEESGAPKRRKVVRQRLWRCFERRRFFAAVTTTARVCFSLSSSADFRQCTLIQTFIFFLFSRFYTHAVRLIVLVTSRSVLPGSRQINRLCWSSNKSTEKYTSSPTPICVLLVFSESACNCRTTTKTKSLAQTPIKVQLIIS